MQNSTSNSTTSPKQITLKNNLIQNFYIIGFSPDDFFKIDLKAKKAEFCPIFKESIEEMPLIKPKILTKFPNTKITFNSIPDKVVIDHCFPTGKIEITNNKSSPRPKSFEFELDNLPQDYIEEEKIIYSKIYFSCLEINESISNYFKYMKEIINILYQVPNIEIKNFDKNQPLGIDVEKKYLNLYIPKVLCFASVYPFYNELGCILDYIHSYYLSKNEFSFLPLEKIIEKVITKIPLPIKKGEELSINFDTYNFKEKIVFPQFNIEELNIDYAANKSLVELFKHFSVDDIIKIFRYIIYEIPILIFSNDKYFLSLFINTFLTVISPFKYIYPHISILPKKLYGLINSQKVFFFGINELFTNNFFEDNKIKLDKTIVIISLDTSIEGSMGKIEERIYDYNSKEEISITTNLLNIDSGDEINNEMINMNGALVNKINVDIPSYFKKKISEGINKYLSFMKKTSFFAKKVSAPSKDFTYKIQRVFFKFFVNIMKGYTDCLYNSSCLYDNKFNKNANLGENIFYKFDDKFKKEVFNENEFILKSPKDNIFFYKIFFKTKMFYFFLKRRIYNNQPLEQVIFRQFDQLTFLKKHHDMRRKKENKIFYDNYKKDFTEKIKIESKNEILIKEEDTFSDKDFENYYTNKTVNMDMLIKYGQLFKLNDNIKLSQKKSDENNMAKIIDIDYMIFPKLNFDYFYRNDTKIEYPLDGAYLENFKIICEKKIEEYEKLRPYAFNKGLLSKLPKVNTSLKNYNIDSIHYIYYIWLLLLSSSLWYCEREERNIRLDKMITFLENNLNIKEIEEYVMNFVFINCYKSASIFNFVKIFLLYNKFIGNLNYFLLYLFCDKILSNLESNNKEKENENDSDINSNNNNNNNIKKDLTFAQRYLVKLDMNKDIETENEINEKDNDNGGIDELIFSSEQECSNCKEIFDIDVKKLLENNINLDIECYNCFCPKCKKQRDLKIKFQILKHNYISKEILLTELGEFLFLTPFKLYKKIKDFFIIEKTTKLDINNIFKLKDKIDLLNILFYFSLLNISFDFLLPYQTKLETNMNLLFNNYKVENIITNPIDKNNIKVRERNTTIKIKYSSKGNLRRFSLLQPSLNQKRESKLLGIFKLKEKYVDSDLSFSFKQNKRKTLK